MDLGLTLERINAQLEEVNERMGALEQKVEAIILPPKALTIEDAEKHLPIRRSAIKAMIARGEIDTVKIGKRKYIPLTEIIRLTSVTRAPVRAPSVALDGPRRKRRAAQRAAGEADGFATVLAKVKIRKRRP